MASVEEKRVFMLASQDEDLARDLSRTIENEIARTKFFFSHSTSDTEFRITNSPPHVVIADIDLPEAGGQALVSALIEGKSAGTMAFIILSPIPDNEFLVDEVVTGRLQFLKDPKNKEEVLCVINKALNYVSSGEQNQYSIRFAGKGEVLLREGDSPDYVYILKRGRMQAYKDNKGEELILGEIEAGEFVGEMAHFNHENRSASVRALDECELIEIPDETLDRVLFTKPSWAKALFLTLSKRVKETNAKLASEDS